LQKQLLDFPNKNFKWHDFVIIMVIHSADGANQSPFGALGINADQAHYFASVEIACWALGIREAHLFYIPLDHANFM
jgi:hypothetical protein